MIVAILETYLPSLPRAGASDDSLVSPGSPGAAGAWSGRWAGAAQTRDGGAASGGVPEGKARLPSSSARLA